VHPGLSEILGFAYFLQNMSVTNRSGKNLSAAERLRAASMMVQPVGEDGSFLMVL
jgi:hypothetical protein